MPSTDSGISRFRRRLARARRERGFTLIEMMVVIVILGVLAGLVVPRFIDQPDKAKLVKAKAQIESLSLALKQYKLDNGFYPTTEQGLKSLKEKPSSGRIPANYPQRGYLDGPLPKDPWNNEFQYICPGEHADFEIVSLGADGQTGGEGTGADIKSWEIN